MTALLQFNSVSKTFNKGRKQINALRNVSFSINEGEVFGFIGPNGAGKSTTIKIILDVINDYEGEVHINNIPAHNANARKDVAYLPESPSLYERFTPMEIMQMALRMYSIQHADEIECCMKWLERFSVAQYANRRIHQLSKGNVQRVALAHTMVVQPRLLILDEPLSGLDPVGRKDVIDILQEYKNGGGSIFFTSHVLHDVERIADRFGFINAGELVTTRDPSELVSKDKDQAHFLIRYRSESKSIDMGNYLRENEYEYELEQNAIPEFVERINQTGGQIINIKPATSLENVFFQILASYQEKS